MSHFNAIVPWIECQRSSTQSGRIRQHGRIPFGAIQRHHAVTFVGVPDAPLNAAHRTAPEPMAADAM